MPHFDYHQGWIFVPDDSQNGTFGPRMGSKPSMLCMIRIHAYLESVEPPDYGHQKKCFHYD